MEVCNDVQHHLEFSKSFFNGGFDNDSAASDCESGVTGGSGGGGDSSSSSGYRRRGVFDEALAVELTEDERSSEVIRRRFLSAMVDNTEVVSLHRRNWALDFSAQARVQSFQFHSKALAAKLRVGCGGGGDVGGGSSVVKFAWFGGSKERIQQVLSRGFSFHDLQHNNNAAIFLSPDHSPAQSVEKSIPDRNGVRHVLLCRVLLGKSELIPANSTQTEPSSDEFDSGVDDFDNPNKYIIWSNNMNSHILPEYVVSFTIPPPSSRITKGFSKMQNAMKMPTSPWISFPALISVLGRFLPADAISLISKYHKEYKERRLSRPELIKIVRQIAGDKLLIAVIKSCKGAKELKIPFGFLRSRNTNKD
ncbi:hypothetical protein SOVF_010200 [Spinacia oleracea]|nr:hypothetical protein SOVF_010200 [Spinacia oleracea]